MSEDTLINSLATQVKLLNLESIQTTNPHVKESKSSPNNFQIVFQNGSSIGPSSIENKESYCQLNWYQDDLPVMTSGRKWDSSKVHLESNTGYVWVSLFFETRIEPSRWLAFSTQCFMFNTTGDKLLLKDLYDTIGSQFRFVP